MKDDKQSCSDCLNGKAGQATAVTAKSEKSPKGDGESCWERTEKSFTLKNDEFRT